MRYHLTRATVEFDYPGVRLQALRPVGVPDELYDFDPPPPVEEDGNARHLYLWTPVDVRWDEQAVIDTIRNAVEDHGHIARSIRVAVIRTVGEPSPNQRTHGEVASRQRAALLGDVDTAWS